MDKILVSVIIPVYNVKKYIKQCLDSVVNQTLKNIEIILIDDCSTDGTSELLKQYAMHDARIKIVRTEKNVNAGASRNIGIRMAKGEYLSFLDSDDFFALNLLEKIYMECAKENLDICIYDCAIYDDKTQKIRECSILNQEEEYLVKNRIFSLETLGDRMLLMWQCALWTRMIRRNLIIQNDLFCQEIHNANDTFFSYASLACAKRVKYIGDGEPLVFYRINTVGQLSNNRGKSPYCIYEALKEIVRFYSDRFAEYMQESFYECIMEHIINSMLSLDYNSRKELILFYQREGLKTLGLTDKYDNCYISAILNYNGENTNAFLQLGNETVVFQNNEKTEHIRQYIGCDKATLWGAGKLGTSFAEICEKHKIPLHSIVDVDKLKQGKALMKNIIEPVEIGIQEADIVLVTNSRWKKAIVEKLKEQNFYGTVVDLFSYYGCGLDLEDCVIDLEQ